MAEAREHSPIVTFRLKQNLYGVSTDQVLNMLEMPEVRPVPHAPDCVRGIINLRGEVLPVVDLRRRLGLGSGQAEVEAFCQLMLDREQDHRNWLEELKASVAEQRPFTLTTDPHRCAFGKWYDHYHTEDLAAQALLKRFNVPHRRIHAVAEKVRKQVAAGNYDQAHQVIERTENRELAKMIELFQALRRHYREERREQAIILEASEFRYAIAVDRIESVEFLADGEQLMKPQGLGELEKVAIEGLGKLEGQDDLVQVLTADSITAGVRLMEMV